MIGERFNRLLVISRAEPTSGNRGKRWNCICDCGNTTVSRSDALKNGRAQSCGCHRAAMGAKRVVAMNTTHGMYHTPEHRVWAGMLHRCRNLNDPRYGGRGVSVCERWTLFENFYADMGARPDGMTLERLDVNGNYEPANCVWADRKVQANNTRSNRKITFRGETKNLSQWAEQFGLPVWKLSQRLVRDHLSFEDAIVNNDRRYRGGATV